MAAGAARSLELLRAIDGVLIALSTITEQNRSFVHVVKEMSEGLTELGLPIPEESIIPEYERLQDELSTIHAELRALCNKCESSTAVRNEDGIRDAFNSACDAINELHASLETFRWLILEHNADLDAVGTETLTSEDEIKRYLAAL